MAKARFLNDDVFFDVLSRLPAKVLAGLKRVSRGWHGLISDRPFVHAQLRRMKHEVSGFIFQQKFQWSDEDFKTVLYIPIEKGNFRVQQTVFDFLPDDVVVLASCKGLVCCRSCFPTRDPAIYICNPLNKEWVTLRWAELDQDSSIAFAFDPHQDPIDTSTNFKLVRVQQFDSDEEEMYFTFEVYSSRTREWKSGNEVCRCNHNLSRSKGVCINGTLYWLTDGGKILTFGLDNELSWLISVPAPATEFNSTPPACIGDSGGKLHYVMISEEGLHLWCLEDYFECEWVLKHWLSLEAMEREYPGFFCNLHERVSQQGSGPCDTPWVNPLAMEDGLLLLRVSTKIYLFDFDTSEMQEVCEAAELGPSSMFFPTVLPYSMSLVPLIH